jgi:hypothetical protein
VKRSRDYVLAHELEVPRRWVLEVDRKAGDGGEALNASQMRGANERRVDTIEDSGHFRWAFYDASELK